MSFLVIGRVSETKPFMKKDDKGNKTDEVGGYFVTLNGWQSGFSCIANADQGDMLPPVGAMVELTCSRESWKRGEKDWGSKIAYSNYRIIE